jgi:hypothetical protein
MHPNSIETSNKGEQHKLIISKPKLSLSITPTQCPKGKKKLAKLGRWQREDWPWQDFLVERVA